MRRAAPFIHDTDAMRIIHHQPRIMRVADRKQITDRRQIAIHRKHAIRRNHAMRVVLAMCAQQLIKMSSIIVAEGLDLRAVKLCPAP